eukprot:g10505.t1
MAICNCDCLADNVYCGLRYIVQAIGEAVATGKRVEIDFEHGKFISSERRANFVFKPELYAKEGTYRLTAPAEAAHAKSSYAPSRTFKPPSTEALKLRLKGTKVRDQSNLESVPEASEGLVKVRKELASEIGAASEHMPFEGNTPAASGVRQLPPMSEQGYGYNEADYGEDDLSQASEASLYDPAKYKGPTVKQEKAHREAMDRYLTEMEIRASEAIADRRQWEEHLDRCLKQERDDMDRKRALAAENQDFIYGPTSW